MVKVGALWYTSETIACSGVDCSAMWCSVYSVVWGIAMHSGLEWKIL